VRYLGIDVGARRVGLAVSDVTGTLARPLRTLQCADVADALAQIARAMAALEDDGRVEAIVVGLPRHLDGSPSDETARVEEFVAALRDRTAAPVFLQDERLTSREAESRLALRERDWRRRKQILDAAAAAVILQDYLDGLATRGSSLDQSRDDPEPVQGSEFGARESNEDES
jgi:putative Holliday junction resolvase